MGIFAASTKSPEAIEKQIHYVPGFVEVRLNGRTAHDKHAGPIGGFGFHYFFRMGSYAVRRNLRHGGSKVPSNHYGGHVFFNPPGKKILDTDVASIHIPIDEWNPGKAVSRLVDMSDAPHEYFLKEAEGERAIAESNFCTTAIAKGIYEYLSAEEEPTWLRERIDAAHRRYLSKEPAFNAFMDGYVEQVKQLAPQTDTL